MQFSLLIRFAPFVIVALLSFGGAWKIQQSRIDTRDVKLSACHDANAASASTLAQYKADAKKSSTACEKTIRANERTIRELKRIDSLGSNSSLHAPGSTMEGGSHATPDNSDPLLTELNGMFTRTAR